MGVVLDYYQNAKEGKVGLEVVFVIKYDLSARQSRTK